MRHLVERLIACLIGCALIWWFLNVHRGYCWAFFSALQGYEKIPPELAAIAAACITSITTIAITGITAVAGIVLFMVTGNVAVLRAFQFASIGQASASVSSAVESRFSHEVSEQTIDEKAPNSNLREFQE